MSIRTGLEWLGFTFIIGLPRCEQGAARGGAAGDPARFLAWAGRVLEILITLVLALHLLAVNVGSAGPLACIWLHRQESRYENVTAGYIGRQLAPLSVTLLSLGVMLGLALLGLLWWADDRAYFEALARFPMTRYWYALGELVFSFVLMALYMLLWDRLRSHPNWHALLAILASTNLLFHFPPLLTSIGVLTARPELVEAAVIDSAQYRQLLLENEVLSRVVHVWLASFAVTGLVVSAYATRISRLEDYREDAIMVSTWGGRLALLPTLGQLLVGIWVTLALPEEARFAVMGEDAWASGLLVLSILAALALMHHLTALALGDASAKTVWRCGLLMALVIVLMTATLRRARLLASDELPPTTAAVTLGPLAEPAPPASQKDLSCRSTWSNSANRKPAVTLPSRSVKASTATPSAPSATAS